MSGFRLNADGDWEITVPAGTTEIYWIDWLKRRILQSSDQIASVAWDVPAGVTKGDEYTVGLKTGVSLATPTVGRYTIRGTVTTDAPARIIPREFIINVE